LPSPRPEQPVHRSARACGASFAFTLGGSAAFEPLVPLEKGECLLRADRDRFPVCPANCETNVGLWVRIRLAPAASRANPEPIWRRRGGRAPQKRWGGGRCDQPRHLLALANDARWGCKARLGPQRFTINRASVCNREPSKSASPRLRAARHPAACHPTSITEPPEDQPKPQSSPRREPLSDLEGLAWSCSSVAEDDQHVPPALRPISSHLVTLGN
jgi:hypothetical protein